MNETHSKHHARSTLNTPLLNSLHRPPPRPYITESALRAVQSRLDAVAHPSEPVAGAMRAELVF